MDTPDINSIEFKDKFTLNKEEKENLIIFPDSNSIGFSTKKTYPKNILFKPAKTKEGKDDSVAVIWVVYKYKEEKDGLVPIYLRISKESKYLMKGYYDYNFEDEESPTKESLEISNKTTIPVELESYGDYFYKKSNDSFYKKSKGKLTKISARKLIEDIYEQHTRTSHRFKGIPFRSKSKLRNFTVAILRLLILFFKRMLKAFFGRNLERKGKDDDILPFFDFETYKKEDLWSTSPNKLSILGFETNVNEKTFKTLCWIIVIASIIEVYLLNINFVRIKILLKNEIFIGAILILSIFMLDNRIPLIFFWLINGLIRLKNKVMFMKLTIK